MTRGRKLSPAERALWNKVARATKPLSDRVQDTHWPPHENADDANLADGVSPGAIGSPQKRRPAAPSLPVRKKPLPMLQPIERPVKRKIAKGRLTLDARLDLHGLVQAEAHDLLQAFLMRAHQRGLRHVLVITGKGSSMGSEGILKRAVPQWLAMPGLRPIVSGYETAARGHGGDGALYIRLKRQQSRP